MSASNSHQILEKTEPSRGVKHVKPPIKPKPALPPRPKEISASGAENKSPLLSPTCGSPSSDIPSALKISQLTGPQPYGTRRTYLKRWSSSVGEDVSQDSALSPVENRSVELPVKSAAAQPVSAPVRPTTTAWKGKSPFMLTTRGWGEQRSIQSRDHNDSEPASQKPRSGPLSKDADGGRSGTTTNEEDSSSRFLAGSGSPVQNSITSLEKSSSRRSGDVRVGSSGSGDSSRLAQSGDHGNQLSAQIQSDHKVNVTVPSIGSKAEKKDPGLPIREPPQMPKSQEGNVKSQTVYDVGSGHVLGSDNLTVDQSVQGNRDKNHQPKAQPIRDVIPENTQHPDPDQSTQQHNEPKDKHVPPKPLPPKPKERKKPSVQFAVPNVEDQGEGQRSIERTAPQPAERETKECGQDGNTDVRRWGGEDGMVEKPKLHRQGKMDEEKKEGPSADEEKSPEASAVIDETPGLVRTAVANYTMRTDDGIRRENTEHHEPESAHPAPHTTERHEKVEYGNQDAQQPEDNHGNQDAKQPEDNHGNQDAHQPEDDHHRSFYKGDVAMTDTEYVPHFTHTTQDPSPVTRSERGHDAYPALDSGTPYIHHHETRTDHLEFHEAGKELRHMSPDPHDKLPSQETYTHPKEFHPSSAPEEPQEELTHRNHELKTSKPGYLQDLTSPESEEFHFSNVEHPTRKVVRSAELSDRSDHKGGIQDSYTESENRKHAHVEEPMQEYPQAEEKSHKHEVLTKAKYGHDEPEELTYTYQHPMEPDHPNIPSEEHSHRKTALKTAEYGYDEPEELTYTYQHPEEPDHPNIPSEEHSQWDTALKTAEYRYDEPKELTSTNQHQEEPDQPNIPSEEHSHRDTVLKTAEYEYDEPEELTYTYQHSEEPGHPNIPSDEESHKVVVFKKERYGYNEPEELASTYQHPEEPDHPNLPSEEHSHRDTVLKTAEYGYKETENIAQHQEEPDHPNIQSKEESHRDRDLKKTRNGYDEREKLVYTYQQQEQPDHPNIQSEEESHRDTEPKKTKHGYEESERLSYTYQYPEESDHSNTDEESHRDEAEKLSYTYQPLEESDHSNTDEESHRDEGYGYKEPEKLSYTYQPLEEPDLKKGKSMCDQPEKQPEKAIHHNVQFEELSHVHEPQTPTVTYDHQSEKTGYTSDHLRESYSQEKQQGRPEKEYEHGEETFRKYVQPEDQPEKIPPHIQSDESHYQQYQYPQPDYKDQSTRLDHQDQSTRPDYQQDQSTRPDYQQDQYPQPDYKDQSTRTDYQQDQYPQPDYKDQFMRSDYQDQSMRLDYQQDQSTRPDYKDQYTRPAYQQKQSEEQYHQERPTVESHYHHKHSDELHYQQPEHLDHKDTSSEDPHIIRDHSEHEDVRTPEGKTEISGEDSRRLKHEYMDLHTTEPETDGGRDTLPEQVKSSTRPEKYLEQLHRRSFPEETHHKNDSTSDTDNKDVISKEEPKNLDIRTVEPRDVHLKEQPDSTITDGQAGQSSSEESRETHDQPEKRLYTEKTINGHYEHEESASNEESSDGPKLSDEINGSSHDEAESDETPEINFDFLEGTTVLDTSLLRGRASLGKKRNHRTPGTCTPEEETDPEYWMFRDSTEPKCVPEKESEEEERGETSPECTPENSPTTAKSTTKKGGIFSGIISPSILKGRLKHRNKNPEDEASKTESKESQEPTSPVSPAKDKSESSSHSLSWLQALKKKKKKQPK